jgi:outer membrane receptor protein involved in Fe transport
MTKTDGMTHEFKPKALFAIAAILGAHASTAAYAATDSSASADEGIPEVVVTATRRTENLQDVPIAMTALTQGTLFGAGAEAGAVRYITNKPKLDKFEAGANASYSTTAHGDPSSGVSAYLNVPLMSVERKSPP